jgi:hypothetical protein
MNSIEDKFYQTMIKLQMSDWLKDASKMTIDDAEFLYRISGIATIYKNGKITFLEEVNEK